MVAALTLMSTGLYLPIWFGLTWVELRREMKDERFMPLGHAVGTLLPGVNAVVAWRHFRLIDDLLKKAGITSRVDPVSAAIGVVIWWLTFTHYSSEPLFQLFNLVEWTAGAAVVAYGQRGLNAYWASRGGEERVLDTDLFALAIAGTWGLLSVVGMLAPAPS